MIASAVTASRSSLVSVGTPAFAGPIAATTALVTATATRAVLDLLGMVVSLVSMRVGPRGWSAGPSRSLA